MDKSEKAQTRIKELRKKADYSFRKLRDASNLSLVQIQKLESPSERYTPLLSTLERYARALSLKLFSPSSHVFLELLELYSFVEDDIKGEALNDLVKLTNDETAKGFWLLTYYRTKAGLDLDSVAEQAGITRSTLRNTEKGLASPKTSTLLNIIAALAPELDKPPSELFFEVIEPNLRKEAA